MLCQRPVAGFAKHPGVLSGAFFLKNFAVTRLTRAVTCKGHGLGGNLSNSIAPIVSILTEATGNKMGTQKQEEGNPGQEDCRYSQKVLGIFKVFHNSIGSRLKIF